MSMTFACGKVESNAEALTNCVYLAKQDFDKLFGRNTDLTYLKFPGGQVFVAKHGAVEPGSVGLNRPQRDWLQVALGDPMKLSVFKPDDKHYMSDLLINVDLLVQGTKPINIDHGALVEYFQTYFLGHYFMIGQVIWAVVDKVRLKCEVKELACMDMAAIMSQKQTQGGTSEIGQLIKQTQIAFQSDRKASVKVQGGGESSLGGGGGQTSLLNPDFNFEKMGIGGLDKEFGSIFRRAFASRIFPAREIAKYGIKHVRGMLLYGPPGTGKTLMARQIGRMLNATEPKIVSGPEILNKFVGESEENIRKLFAEAEAEYSERGDDSTLHIIIFDEIDAICKARGTRNNGTGVGDTVVNQLLAKLDGVNQLNNILVIGMTNRKEMIDEALLRPGRLEVHMEIGLPDEKGRLQILSIHTHKMKENKKMGPDVDLDVLAKKTKNFSGAEIEGLVKSATAFALNEVVNADDVGKNMSKVQTPIVKMIHFESALTEVIPAFGLDQNEFENLRGAITPFSKEFQRVMQSLKQFVAQIQNSDRTPLLTVLLSGEVGCGKTSVALDVALGSDFPFVKLLNPANLVAYPENVRCEKIAKVFEDAHKSPLSIIVVDDIERLIDYVAIGPRFSNSILQTLAVYLRMPPPTKGRKLMVIGTTSKKKVLEMMEITECFNASLDIPNVMSGTEAVRVLQAPGHNYPREDLKRIMDGFQQDIPVKKLLMISEMAKQGSADLDLGTRFLDALATYH